MSAAVSWVCTLDITKDKPDIPHVLTDEVESEHFVSLVGLFKSTNNYKLVALQCTHL